MAEPSRGPAEARLRLEHALIWLNHADNGDCTTNQAHEAVRGLLCAALDHMEDQS